jgi:hypothetical protein
MIDRHESSAWLAASRADVSASAALPSAACASKGFPASEMAGCTGTDPVGLPIGAPSLQPPQDLATL